MCVAGYGQVFNNRIFSVTAVKAASLIAELDDDAKICITGPLDRVLLAYIMSAINKLESNIKVYLDLSVATTDLEDLEKIESKIFSECSMIAGIVLPNSVMKIEAGAFYGCTALESITVTPENKYFCSKDGVLYSKDMKTIIAYPTGKKSVSFDIPNSVTKIETGSFYACEELKSVTISNSVTEIG